jgi:tetratricopeptide (TPR) repeat protein
MRVKLRAALLLLLFGFMVWSTGRLRTAAMGHYLSARQYEGIYYLPPPQWLPVLSIGYRKVLADLLWMKALIYFGDELFHRSNARHLYDYADAILTLDHRFKAVYHWVASCALYRTGEITLADVKKAISYLERAVKLFPSDGGLAWDLGATYSYELSPMLDDPAQRMEAKRKGVEHLHFAVLRGAAPPWVALANASLLTKLGRTEQAIRHLEETYTSITDATHREQIEKRLSLLRSEAFTEAFTYTVRAFEQARQRDFPFVSPGLYWQLGSRPPYDGINLLLHHFDPMQEDTAAETL